MIGVPTVLSSPARPGARALAWRRPAALPAGLPIPLAAAFLVVAPVFVQAPWVRSAPMAAALFTVPLVGLALLLERQEEGRTRQLGLLLAGFSASWLGGALFWGWCRLHPALHLPVEGFALPIALAGLSGRWRPAASFYLASLLGTAATDGAMALTGVMGLWPRVLEAPLSVAPLLLQEAAGRLIAPLPLTLLTVSAALLLGIAGLLWRRGGIAARVAAATLATTVVVDGLFLASALLAPRLSGLV
ncbi:MAG: DUF3120 domain-containing protein [Synechococcaceae cyanobacterium]|nr:DUF3120 domain-containing protein [Synechococcaceae cyanobacterium]